MKAHWEPYPRDVHVPWYAGPMGAKEKLRTEELARELCSWLVGLMPQIGHRPVILGVGGGPGSGKSTLVELLGRVFREDYGLRQAAFSLDDVYLTRQERQRLAHQLHHAFAQRGLPGTHDLQLAFSVIRRLQQASEQTEVALPRFDKGRDDRVPEEKWPRFVGRPDWITIDGWCWNARPEAEKELKDPINDFERNNDPDGLLRQEANGRLAGEYQQLFERADAHVHLISPDWETTVRFRVQQERELGRRAERDRPAAMTEDEVRRFLEPFERIACRPPAIRRWSAMAHLSADRSVERLLFVLPSGQLR